MGKVLTKTMSKQSLSPAAQAVMDAWWGDSKSHQSGIAAVLRAAADQMSCYQSKMFLYSIADATKLLTIAAELEAYQ